MIDFPQAYVQEYTQTQPAEYEGLLAVRTSRSIGLPKPVSTKKSFLTSIEQDFSSLFSGAKSLIAEIGGYLQWKDLCSLIVKSFQYVKTNTHLPTEAEMHSVLTMVIHAISVADKTFLTCYNEVLSSTISPVFVNLVNNVMNNLFHITITPSTGVPTQQDLMNFINTVRAAFPNGKATWADVPNCIAQAVGFMQGYASLTVAQKEQGVTNLLESIVDTVSIPDVPDAIVDTVFNTLIPPFVTFMFKSLNSTNTTTNPTPASTPVPATAASGAS
jgi:hypothetical protein